MQRIMRHCSTVLQIQASCKSARALHLAVARTYGKLCRGARSCLYKNSRLPEVPSLTSTRHISCACAGTPSEYHPRKRLGAPEDTLRTTRFSPSTRTRSQEAATTTTATKTTALNFREPLVLGASNELPQVVASGSLDAVFLWTNGSDPKIADGTDRRTREWNELYYALKLFKANAVNVRRVLVVAPAGVRPCVDPPPPHTHTSTHTLTHTHTH